MKNKDIKRRFKNKITSGWREYLPITINKKHLGLSNVDFPTIKNIERCLGVKYLMDSHFVNHFIMSLPGEFIDGFQKGIILELNSDYIHTTLEDTLERLKELYTNDEGDFDLTYLVDNNTVYYLKYKEGVLNPNYSKNLESNEPFWHKSYKVEEGILIGNEEPIIELLQMFANESKLESILYSENPFLPLINGKTYQVTNELGADLAKLEEYTKTLYFNYCGDDIIITYAIRYKSNVKPFLKDLKALIKKHKNLNIR